MTDVRARIAMARQRFGKMRHIWTDNNVLHQNLRIRLYRSCVCSIMTYGSETWNIIPAVSRALNGANSNMMIIITGKTQQQEASSKWVCPSVSVCRSVVTLPLQICKIHFLYKNTIRTTRLRFASIWRGNSKTGQVTNH